MPKVPLILREWKLHVYWQKDKKLLWKIYNVYFPVSRYNIQKHITVCLNVNAAVYSSRFSENCQCTGLVLDFLKTEIRRTFLVWICDKTFNTLKADKSDLSYCACYCIGLPHGSTLSMGREVGNLVYVKQIYTQ